MAKKQTRSNRKKVVGKITPSKISVPSIKKLHRFNPKLPEPLETKTAQRIISEFLDWVNHHSIAFVDFGRWYCGITNHPPTRKIQHQYSIGTDPYAWTHQSAGSRRIAEAIETYFHKQGMLDHDSKGGSSINSKYVYIYKKKPTIFD